MDSPAVADKTTTRGEAPPEQDIRQQQLRLDFLTAFHAAFKGARFFPPQNESVIKRIRKLLDLINQIIGNDGACRLELTYDFLALNGTRLKTDVAGLVPYNLMMETMEKLKTGGVYFDPGISFDELQRFLYVFAKTDPKDSGEDTFDMLEEGIEHEGLQTVRVERMEEKSIEDRNRDLRRQSIDIYFQSISVAKNILQNAHAGKAVNFRKAKRAVQTMVDIANENRFFLLAMTSIKNYDEYTYSHSSNVAVLAISFGQYLGLNNRLLGSLGMSALLHDIGKTEIDKDLLNKPGKLTRDEWDVLKTHPVLGVKMLLKSAQLNEMLVRAMIVAFQHHKGNDLQGYPAGNSDRDLNLLSRIVAICDCYDALTTPRVYRTKSYSAAEALSIMLDDANAAYDKELLNEFAVFISLYPVGTMLKLDTEETAIVYRVIHKREKLDRPHVKIIADKDGNRVEPFVVDLSEQDESGNYKRNIIQVIPPSGHFKNLQDYFELL